MTHLIPKHERPSLGRPKLNNIRSDALRMYRAGGRLSLQDIAEIFGVNKTTVQRWEEGQIPAERVLAIAKATGIPPHKLRPDIYPPPKRERASA